MLVLCCAYLLSASQTRADELQGTLHLGNGDTFQGSLQPSTDQTIRWLSDRFDGVFSFGHEFIDSIKCKTEGPHPESHEPFRVTTYQGEVFHGKLMSVSEELVELHADRFDEARLKRDHIREIRQAKHTQMLYDGPRWLDGWRVLKAGRRISEWVANEHGFLETSTYGAELFHELPELDVAEIHVTLTWKGKPGFQLDFSSASELMTREPARLSVKSWSDDVVAQSALDVSDFKALGKLTPRSKELRLRMVWNNKAHTVSIHDASGTRLGQLQIDDKDRSSGFGVLIKNRGDDLLIQQIRVSRWNGADPTNDRKTGSSYLRLANGELITAPIAGIDATAGSVSVGGEQPRQLSLDDVAIIEFASPVQRDIDDVTLRFSDGNEVVGKLRAVESEHISVESPSSDPLLQLKYDGLEELRFNGSLLARSQRSDFSIVFADGHRSSGTLAAANEAGVAGWQPLGSTTAVALPLHRKFIIERRAEIDASVPGVPDKIQRFDSRLRMVEPISRTDANGQSEDSTSESTQVKSPRRPIVEDATAVEDSSPATEMIRLSDGTALVGAVELIDDRVAVIQSDYVSEHRVPRSEIRAIESLAAPGRVSFNSDDWQFVGSARPVNRSSEKLEVAHPISMRDLSLKHDGRMTVLAAWDENFVGLLTIHLGTSSKRPLTSIARFTFNGERVIARCLQDVRSRPLPSFPDRRATITLLSDDEHIRMWVSGVLAFEHRLTSPLPDLGLWLQCGSAKGPLTDRAEQPRLVLDGLRVGEAVDAEGLGYFNSTQKQVLLQVPRNRKKNAPQHMLFARNGDVVRGDLVSITADRVQFRSRHSDLSFPREQVSAVTWLEPLEGEGDPGARATEADALVALRDGSLIRLPEMRVQGDMIEGQHPYLGRCRVSIDSVLKVYSGKGGAWFASHPFSEWQLVAAPEPKFSIGDAEQGIESDLLGQLVDDVVLPMLDQEPLAISSQKGRVVVLDFWATWCAPCIRSLPVLSETVSQFPRDKVTFVAVNQEDDETSLRAFLEAREWEFAVGTDSNGAISRRFLVEAIPQTVIIGPDGTVAKVFVGAPLGLHDGIAQVLAELLAK